jgi:hypothetical protein
LVTLNSGLPSRWLERRLFKVEIQILRRSGAREDLAVRCSSYPSYSVVRVLRRRGTHRRPGHEFPD